MATRNISTKVAIEGESAYKSALTQINSELKALQSSLKLATSEFQNNQNSMDALTSKGDALSALYEWQSKKVDTLKEALENAKSAQQTWADRVEAAKAKVTAASQAMEEFTASGEENAEKQQELQAALDSANAELEQAQNGYNAATRGVNNWQTQVNNAQVQLNDLDAEIQQNNQYMEEAAKSADGCATSIDEFGKKSKDTSGEVANMGVSMGELAGFFTAMVAACKKGVEAVMQFEETFIDFEAQMDKVSALSGTTGEALDSLTEAARDAGRSTTYSATEAAEALEYMALAGWDDAEMVDGLMPILRLAQASAMDLGTASDIVTDYLTAFGLSASDSSKFVDEMAYAMANSNTTTEALGEAYKNCAASAASMGYSVEEVTSVLMVMANSGIKGGEAGTALNAIMTRLATNTKGCADALEDYDVHIYDDAGNMQSLSSILQGVANVWSGLSDAEQATLAKSIAGTSHYSALQTIMSGLSDATDDGTSSFEAYAAALEEADGAAEDMAETMTDNLSGALAILKSEWEDFKINIGSMFDAQDIEALIELLDVLNGKMAGGNTIGVDAAPASTYQTEYMGTTGVLDDSATKADMQANIDYWQGIVDSFESLNTEYETLYENGVAYVDMAYADNADKALTYQTAYQNLRDAQIQLVEAQSAADEAAKNAIETGSQVVLSEEEQAAAIEAVTTAVDELAQSYADGYDAALQSIQGQVGLFTEYKAELDESCDSTAEMIAIWQQQADAINQYSDNLQTLSDAGLSEDLIASLSDGSAESAAAVAQIASEIEACGEDADAAASLVDSLNTAFAGVGEAESGFATAVENINIQDAVDEVVAQAEAADYSGIGEAIQGAFDAVDLTEQGAAIADSAVAGMESKESAAEDAGGNVGQSASNGLTGKSSLMFNSGTTTGNQLVNGMISGINSRSSALYTTISGVIDTAIATANSAAGVASPSKKTRKMFQYVGDGMVLGIKDRADAIKSAMTEVTDSALSGASFALDGVDTSDPTVSVMSTIRGTVSEDARVLTLLSNYLPQLLAKESNTYLDGTLVSNKLAPSMDAALGRRKRLA